MTGPPAGSSDPKTSIGQSIQRRSSQKGHVVSAESASSGSAAAIVSATHSSAAHLIEQNPRCGTPKCEYPPKRTPAWTIAAAAKSDVSTARKRNSF
jgi:hypothetical protein